MAEEWYCDWYRGFFSLAGKVDIRQRLLIRIQLPEQALLKIDSLQEVFKMGLPKRWVSVSPVLWSEPFSENFALSEIRKA